MRNGQFEPGQNLKQVIQGRKAQGIAIQVERPLEPGRGQASQLCCRAGRDWLNPVEWSGAQVLIGEQIDQKGRVKCLQAVGRLDRKIKIVAAFGDVDHTI